MLDAQLIVKRILEPEKTNLGFVFKKLLPDEEFSEHNALEDARATQRVYEEVKSRCSLDDPGMTKMCPGFDPRRDQVVHEKDHTGVSSDLLFLQAVKNVFNKVIDSVMQSSNTGWLDTSIDKAVSDMLNVDKLFSSNMLKDAVIEVQDKQKTWEVKIIVVLDLVQILNNLSQTQVEEMLSKLSFSSEEVAKISENPFKNLKTLVDDLKVQVNKGKGKTTSVKVILESR